MFPSINGEEGGLSWLALLFFVGVSLACIYGGPSEPRNP